MCWWASAARVSCPDPVILSDREGDACGWSCQQGASSAGTSHRALGPGHAGWACLGKSHGLGAAGSVLCLQDPKRHWNYVVGARLGCKRAEKEPEWGGILLLRNQTAC